MLQTPPHDTPKAAAAKNGVAASRLAVAMEAWRGNAELLASLAIVLAGLDE